MFTLNIQKGKDLFCKNGIIFKNPKLCDIETLGEDIYFWFIYCWIQKPEDCLLELFSKGIDMDEMSHYELFLIKIKDNFEIFSNILMYFSNVEYVELKYDDEWEEELLYCNITYENNKYFIKIDLDVFNEIYEFLKIIHFYKHENKRYFDSKKTRDSILEYELEEKEHENKINKNKNSSSIANMISTIVTGNKRTWEYTYSLYVIQLFDEYFRLVKEKDANNLYYGIYTGNIDINKINKNDLNWTGSLVD